MSKKNAKPYSEKIHIWGRISSITAIAALMLVPIAISAHYNAWPEAGKLFNAMKVVIPVYWISGIAEVFTYAPMLGAGGTYLSFVTGNITKDQAFSILILRICYQQIVHSAYAGLF